MSSDESKQIAMEYIERFNAGDIAHAHELLDDDLVWWVAGDLPFSGDIRKPEFRKNNEMIVGLFKTFPKWIVDSAIAEGDKVAVIAHSAGDTIDGFEYRNKYHILFTVRDGKIIRADEYMDTKHCWDLLASFDAAQQHAKTEG